MVIKKTLLLGFFLIFIPFAFASNLTLISPSEVNLNSEFSVSIDFPSEEPYDVKIFVHEATREFSEIFNGEKWASPFYYISGAFPGKKEFSIISHYLGETNICARLRKSSQHSDVIETCNPIKILPAIPENPEQNNSNENEEERQEEVNEEVNETEEAPKEEKKQEIKQNSTGNPQKPVNQSNEKIVLNYQKETNSEAPEIFRTKQDKTRIAFLYAFAIFCIFLIILLALRKL